MMPARFRRFIVLSAAVSVLAWPRATDLALAKSPNVPFRLMETTIRETQAALEAGTITSEDLVRMYLARIDAYDKRGPSINAFIRLNPNAIVEARALDAERRARRVRGPLHGVPIVLKDNYDTYDMPTSAASLSLATSVPPDDGYLVRRLREAGAIFIGKVNMHEFAFGITNISSLGGQTLNPYDLTRNPGGSSGGTGAAVAANFAVLGMGSDTCGSIRIPSSHNSLVGLRVTQGLFSRDGIIPLALTQDVGGPLARSVEDIAIVLDATAGFDLNDPVTEVSTLHTPSTYTNFLNTGRLRGARFGVLEDSMGTDPLDQEVANIIRAAARELEGEGATVIKVFIPDYAIVSNTSVITMEFKAHLDQYLKATPGAPLKSLQEIVASGLFHPAVAGNLAGALASSNTTPAYFARLAGRQVFKAALLQAMADEDLDALIYPTIRRKPVVVGANQPGSNCRNSAQSGLPAISVPVGFTLDGLPVGMEFLGAEFTEGQLLEFAYSWEQAKHVRRVPASTPDIAPAWSHHVTDGTAAFHLNHATRQFRFSAPAAGIDTFVYIDRAMQSTGGLVHGETKDGRWHIRYSIGIAGPHRSTVWVNDLWDKAGAYTLHGAAVAGS